MRWFWSLIKFLVLVILALVAGAGIGVFSAVYWHYSHQLPLLDAALNYRPPLITKVYDRHGVLLAEFASERRIIVSLSEIPQAMRDAIIAIEDNHFYSHSGLDVPGIMRAAIENFKAGHVVQGGSTLTQQLAKTLFLTREKTLSRKIKEALLALQLEQRLTKDRILELYLNQVYFGSGAYGVEAAARRYFDKSCSELTLAEAALLAGLPKAPSRFSPLRNPELALNRRNVVLRRMFENGFISKEKMEDARQKPLGLHPHPPDPFKAPYFVEVLRRRLEKRFGHDVLYSSGMKIYTTLDYRYQVAAEKAVRRGVRKADRKRGWRGPLRDAEPAKEPPEPDEPAVAVITDVRKDRLTLTCGGLPATLLFKDIWIKNKFLRQLKPGDLVWCVVDEYETEADGSRRIKACHITQEPELEGALLSMDAETGEVFAWVGGYDYNRSQFDRVSQSRRQPGSAFKPFIYATALDGEYTAADIIYDTPIVVEKTWEKKPEKEEEKKVSDGDNAEEEEEKSFWKPHNYSEQFYGATTLRTGLEKSRNIISIHLLQKVGVSRVIRMARQLGIESPLTNTLSLALGASDLSLFELTRAYGAFATVGLSAEPIVIRRIKDRDDRIMEETYPVVRRSLRADTAYLICNLLQGVIQHGTGYAARSLGYPLGGKTGTTNNYHDAWFMGFSPHVVTGVWVGSDKLAPIGKRATGAAVALPIWMDFMRVILAGYEPDPFPVPDGIVFARICRKSGLLATSRCESVINEAFREGTEPILYCDVCGRRVSRVESQVQLDWDQEPVESIRTDESEPEGTGEGTESDKTSAGEID